MNWLNEVLLCYMLLGTIKVLMNLEVLLDWVKFEGYKGWCRKIKAKKKIYILDKGPIALLYYLLARGGPIALLLMPTLYTECEWMVRMTITKGE